MLKNYENKLKGIQNLMLDIVAETLDSMNIVFSGFENQDRTVLPKASNILFHVGSLIPNVNEKILIILALFSPNASDLKKIMAYMQILGELRRIKSNIGTYSKCFDIYFDSDVCSKEINSFLLSLHRCSWKSMKILKGNFFLINKEGAEDKIKINYSAIKAQKIKALSIYSLLERHIYSVLLEKNKQYIIKEYFYSLEGFIKLRNINKKALNIADYFMFGKTGNISRVLKRRYLKSL